MSAPTDDPDKGRFDEPSEAIKRRNRITGYILLAIVIGLVALGMVVRVYK